MPLYDGKKLAYDALLDIAKFCTQSALHSPQITGTLNYKVEILVGDELLDYFEMNDELAKLGIRTTAESYRPNYNKGEPPVVVLIGADCRPAPILNWDCGACGFNTCVEAATYQRQREREVGGDAWGYFLIGPSCVWRIMELGIACDWAAAAAHNFNVDTRVQIVPGGYFIRLGYLEGCSVACAIPLGPVREHVYFNPGSGRAPAATSRKAELDAKALRYPTPWIKFQGPGIDMGRTTMMDKQDWWNPPHRYLKMVEDPEWDQMIEERRAKIVEVTDRIRKRRQERKEAEKKQAEGITSPQQ